VGNFCGESGVKEEAAAAVSCLRGHKTNRCQRAGGERRAREEKRRKGTNL